MMSFESPLAGRSVKLEPEPTNDVAVTIPELTLIPPEVTLIPSLAVIIPTESTLVTSSYVRVPPIETLPVKIAEEAVTTPVMLIPPAPVMPYPTGQTMEHQS